MTQRAERLTLSCIETNCAASVEIVVVAGQPHATEPFETQAPGWGYSAKSGESALCCPMHYQTRS